MTAMPGTQTRSLTTTQPAPAELWGMTRNQLDLLKRTIAKGTSDDEFALYMSTAQRLGLDPLAKQIYAVMRYSRRDDRHVMSIQVSIDGFRAIANKTAQCDGQEGPYWCGPDGVWKDVWLESAPPSAAKVVVFRKGQTRGYTGIATYESYCQQDKDGNPNDFWERLPDVMIAKCAEAIALRKAFPSQLSGVYTPDEMGQADNVIEAGSTTKTPPPPRDPEQEVELDEGRLAALVGRIREAKSYGDMLALRSRCAKLVPHQKDIVRTEWSTKTAKEGWTSNDSDPKPS